MNSGRNCYTLAEAVLNLDRSCSRPEQKLSLLAQKLFQSRAEVVLYLKRSCSKSLSQMF